MSETAQVHAIGRGLADAAILVRLLILVDRLAGSHEITRMKAEVEMDLDQLPNLDLAKDTDAALLVRNVAKDRARAIFKAAQSGS